MSLHVIFASQGDLDAFTKTLALISPEASNAPDNWVPVVAKVPGNVGNDQYIAAWKKWYGIGTLLDMGAEAPEYGLMLDAELRLFDPEDCGADSAWLGLYRRLQAMEKSKSWPAARVGTRVSYDLSTAGHNQSITGQDYDRELIKQNARFVAQGTLDECTTSGCQEVKGQIDNVLFSWWTDLPYLNLEVASRMLTALSVPQQRVDTAPLGHWQQLVIGTRFPPFEHMAYQQWCVLHEGFTFRDVTALVGEAKWGSYLEDAPDNAKIYELHPLWVSGDTFGRILKGKVPPMNATEKPLMLFHVDHRSFLWPDIKRMEDGWTEASSGHPHKVVTPVADEHWPKRRPTDRHVDTLVAEPHAYMTVQPLSAGLAILALLLLAFAAPWVQFKHFVAMMYLATSVAIDLSIALQKSGSDTHSKHLYEFNPVVAVLLTEVIKLCISVVWFLLTPRTGPPAMPSLSEMRWLSMPAVIFTANNILVWWAIGKNDVGVFGVFRDTMILWTAMLWCFVHQTSLGVARVAAIGVVFTGLAVNRAGSLFDGSPWSWTFLWVLGMTLCNVTGSVVNEYALKKSRQLDLNLQNSILYLACALFSAMVLVKTQPEVLWNPHSVLTGISRWTLLTCMLQACAGLLVSRLLKYTDSIWKTAACCLRGPWLVLLSWFVPGLVMKRDIVCLVSAVIVAAGSFAYLVQGPIVSEGSETKHLAKPNDYFVQGPLASEGRRHAKPV